LVINQEIFLQLLEAKDVDSLECAICLLTTIGKNIDQRKGSILIGQYFQRMERILQEEKVCGRVHFLLMNLMDLRQNNWIPRHLHEEGPRMIPEIQVVCSGDKRLLLIK
jgi:translation initiation factor 4G